jgi:hypothetical protein
MLLLGYHLLQLNQTDEFLHDAVRITQTSGLMHKQISASKAPSLA